MLGGTKTAWVGARGQPTRALGIYDRFPGGFDLVWGDATGGERARHIELVLGSEQPVQQARTAARALHPKDGASVRTYTAPAGQTVEVFHSSALAQAFAGGPYFGEEDPGTYIQIAERGAPRTARVVIALGNRP